MAHLHIVRRKESGKKQL